MDQLESARAFKFGSEMMVEIQGTDDRGAVDVISYEFAFEDQGQALTPKESVADEHVSIVRDALEEAGFRWVTVIE